MLPEQVLLLTPHLHFQHDNEEQGKRQHCPCGPYQPETNGEGEEPRVRGVADEPKRT